MTSPERPFDPVGLLRELERGRVGYVLVGTLAGVIRGAPEQTSVVEICPSLKRENLLRLERTLASVGALPADTGGHLSQMSVDAVRRFATPYGDL